MFDRLPDPDRTPLKAAPVNLVVFAWNYATTAPWGAQAGIRWRDRLNERGLSGKLVGVTRQQVQVVSGVISSDSPPKAGHQIQFSDNSTASLYEDAMILEARQYAGWPKFRAFVRSALEAAAEQRGPEVSLGISLRYVNALSDARASSASFWQDKVHPSFLGPAANDDLADELLRGVYLLSFGGGAMNAELRIGIQPDAIHARRIAYVFDMEFADSEQCAFGIEDVLDRADALNTASLKLFQRIVTPNYLQELAHA